MHVFTSEPRHSKVWAVHTYGGERGFDGASYESKFCAPGTEPYSGSERVYRLDLPAQTKADIELESPCADLDLFAMTWSDEGRCPGPKHSVSICEADVKKKGGAVHIENVKNPLRWLVVVDGKGGVEAPFQLRVTCVGRD